MTEPDDTELVIPFVCTTSKGGPYDDDAFVAGWYAAELDMALETVGRFSGGLVRAVPTPLVPQIDLIAMRHGWICTAELVEEAEGWSAVRLSTPIPDEPDDET